MFLNCEHSNAMNLAVNLTSQCNMNCFCNGVAYSPVCYAKTETTFFSPCHAACNQWDNEKKIYSGCSCAAEYLTDIAGNDSTIGLKSTFLSNDIEGISITTTDPFPDDEILNEDEYNEVESGRLKREADSFLENVMTPGTVQHTFQPYHIVSNRKNKFLFQDHVWLDVLTHFISSHSSCFRSIGSVQRVESGIFFLLFGMKDIFVYSISLRRKSFS